MVVFRLILNFSLSLRNTFFINASSLDRSNFISKHGGGNCSANPRERMVVDKKKKKKSKRIKKTDTQNEHGDPEQGDKLE